MSPAAALSIDDTALDEVPVKRGPGPLAELLLVGGATLLLFPLSWCLRTLLGLSDAELAVGFVMFYAAHLINDPHFAVTYLLFYQDLRARAFGSAFPRGQRIRYWLAGFVAPLLLGVWVVAGLSSRSAPSLGVLIQLMFLLVGWHYVKQSFGMLMVLSARRQVRFSRTERIVILAHCYAAWAYAWASPFDPGRRLEEKGVVYGTFAHPSGLLAVTFACLLCTIPPLVWALFKKWRDERTLPLGPIAVFLCSVWLWTIYSSLDPLVRYAIPALHSVQYLYFVWLLRSNQARERERAPFFEPSVATRVMGLLASAVGLGWLLFHGVPWLLDDTLVTRAMARSDLGPTPYFAALYAFVNIHHYLMDAVLWRHDNPLTRYLRAV